MKRITALLAIIAFVMVSCGAPSPIGKWQLESISGEDLTEEEKGTIIELREDGSMEATRGKRVKKGDWELSEDGKTMYFIGEEGDKEEMSNVELSTDKMSFTERSNRVTLKRLN